MLVLIFSSEKSIKEEVLNTYHIIYTDSKIRKVFYHYIKKFYILKLLLYNYLLYIA